MPNGTASCSPDADDITISMPNQQRRFKQYDSRFVPRQTLGLLSRCQVYLGFGNFFFFIIQHESAHLSPPPTCLIHLWRVSASKPRVQYTDAAFLQEVSIHCILFVLHMRISVQRGGATISRVDIDRSTMLLMPAVGCSSFPRWTLRWPSGR